MKSLFSNSIVNTGRQTELDILKVITIFNMIFMHLQEVVFSFSYKDREFVQNSWWILFVCNAMYLVGPFSFLFSMGCTIPFSRSNEAKTNMRRGFGLAIVWFALNLVRVFPIAINNMIYLGIPFKETYFKFIWANDVLFFAGVFFLLYGFLQMLDFSFRKIAFVFTAMFFIAQCVGNWGRFLPSWSYPWLSGIVRIDHYSSFPLLNWGLVVTLGMISGGFLQRCLDKTKLYAILGVSGGLAVIVMLPLLFITGALETDVLLKTVSNPLSMHQANIISVACGIGCLALLLGIFHLLCIILPEKVKKGISFISGKILSIYIAHWVILPGLCFYPWMRNGRAGFGKIATVALSLYLVSFFLILVYEFLVNSLKNPKPLFSRHDSHYSHARK